MNISGVPLLAEPSNLPASSTLPETDWENIPVHENDVTTVLMQRWIACYMLYDWNLLNAESAYEDDMCIWVLEVCRRLEGTTINARSLESTLTDTFNHVLLEDVEGFIQQHMSEWKCDRATVELWIAWAISELFPVKPLPGRQ